MTLKTYKLASGFTMPAIGLGTWKLRGIVARQAVSDALAMGYRHIDTADVYGNHREVGEAIRTSGVAREEIFLTTKVWHDSLRTADVAASIQRFLKELQTPYLDLVLIHWPNSGVPIVETLHALDQARQKGFVRSIGVSNFTREHLEEARASGVTVSVNQVEFHPTLYQRELLEYCRAHTILLTAYSPVGRGHDLSLPLIKELANRYHKSLAQIILNWLLSKNIVVIPKATSAEHLKENLAAGDFVLSNEDVIALDNLATDHDRLVNPPFAEFKGPKHNRLAGVITATIGALARYFVSK